MATTLFLIAAAPVRLKSVAVELPAEEAMFDDELLIANCTACHSASMVTVQPRMGVAQWRATVDKMRVVYKAPIADEDVAGIVGALAALSEQATAK